MDEIEITVRAPLECDPGLLLPESEWGQYRLQIFVGGWREPTGVEAGIAGKWTNAFVSEPSIAAAASHANMLAPHLWRVVNKYGVPVWGEGVGLTV